MRWYSPRVIKSLAVGLLFAVFAPSLLCGGAAFTTSEAMDCCRAMEYKCHTKNSMGACCQHQASAPLQAAVTSVSGVSINPALAPAVLLPPFTNYTILTAAADQKRFAIFAGDSPPGNIPLFLAHLTLLI